MTLTEMSDYVCLKINQTENEDIAACKGFLRRRYAMIWNDQLWKDSLVQVDVAFDPDNNTNENGILLLPEIVDRVLAVRTSENQVKVVSLEQYYRIDFDQFSQEGTACEFAILSPVWFIVWPDDSAGAGSTILIRSDEDSDTSEIKVIWRDLSGKRYETTGDLPSVELAPDDDDGYFEVQSMFKSETTGSMSIRVMRNGNTYLNVATLDPTDLRSPSYQRIRLVRIPQADTTFKVLGKAKCEELDFDSQEPVIRGIENCLMAFAQSDMLQRSRQYSKAEAVAQEALALLEQLKKVETVQQAHNQRLIPDQTGDNWSDLLNTSPLEF